MILIFFKISVVDFESIFTKRGKLTAETVSSCSYRVNGEYIIRPSDIDYDNYLQKHTQLILRLGRYQLRDFYIDMENISYNLLESEVEVENNTSNN